MAGEKDLIEGFGNEVLSTFIIIAIVIISVYHYAPRGNYILQLLGFLSGLLPFLGPAAPANIERPGVPFNNDTCPICLSLATLALETNCGHVFGGRCLIVLWRVGEFGLQGMSCPICRQQITMLFTMFTQAEQDAPAGSPLAIRRENILRDLHEYNRRFSGQPRTVKIMEIIRDIPTLLRHMWNDLSSEEGLNIIFKARMILCLVVVVFYIILPLDFVPEAIFGLLGLIDDFIALVILVVYLSIMYRHTVIDRAVQQWGEESNENVEGLVNH